MRGSERERGRYNYEKIRKKEIGREKEREEIERVK